MTLRTHSRARHLRATLLLALCALALGVVAPSPNAASAGPLTVTAVSWDVIGLDSNNVNTGPNAFPVGIRVCNTGSDEATNVVATWSWKSSQNAFTGPAEGATVSVGTMAAGTCRQVFFEVTLNRSPSSRLKSRDYQITVTADGGLSTVGAQRQLYAEKLVSQNRNSTKKLAGPGGCNLTYTVCDPAIANVVVGKTYTYKFYAETSTAYQQLETFVNFPSSAVQVVSTSSTYSNPAGASSTSIYANACGWSTVPTTRACVGPATIPGGKAGGRIVATYVVRAVAPGSGTLKSTIYDFSGSSYHYNADHDTFALLSGPYTARFGVDTTIVGNGKVTSAPSGTRSDGTSGGIDCGYTGVTCSVGYATGTSVTLTAQPLGTDTFVGWSGAGCSGTSLTCTVSMSESRSVTATFTGVTTYPLEVSKTGSGTVSADVGALACGSTCTSRYADGTAVTLTAAPSAGWTFDGWSGEGCSGTGTCSVTLSQARSVSATFTEQTYGLSASVAGNGTVASSPGTISCGNGNTFCSEVYGSGTVVTLTASPGSGQTFTGWTGACSGTSVTCTVTMSEARAVTATFTGTATYPLEVGVGGSGTGTVTSNVGGINCGATCSASYTDGTLVTLTATAGAGSNFVGWSGDCSGTDTTCVVTMSAARNAFANFGVPQTLTVAKGGSGSGTVTSNVGGINCGATCSASIAEGTTVTLTATPAAGSTFTGWSGDCSGTGACTVTMSTARSVTATFATSYALSVTRSGSGTGSVTSEPAGITCGATCSASYASGTIVTLTATAAAGSRFAGWSGSGCSGTDACTVTMSSIRSVTATFVALHSLAVTKSRSDAGTVASAPSGVSCGATCSAEFDEGTSVTLTATAAAGFRFAGWSGAGCSGTGSCTVDMTASRSVTATFVSVHLLSVTKAGSGTGTVSGGAIDCGSTCSADIDDGAEVTLAAAAAPGSRFTGWSGGGCTGTGTCTVTMGGARSVTATFVLVRTLTVAKSGSGSGTVSGGGIDCGSTCTADFDDGDDVTLTATAASGSRFTGWSGSGCTGTSACTVTMTAARSATATFVALRTLTVTKSGSGNGRVSGGGIDCGLTCSAELDDGDEVTLTASAASGSRFTGWSGAGCSGTGTCTVTMSAARAVTGTFLALHPLDVSKAGSGSGTVASEPAGIDCGAACSETFDEGTEVVLSAGAAAGSSFAGWSGAGCSGTGTCTVTMSSSRSVTATFVALRTLSVVKSGSGSGTVNGGGIDCGSTCAADFDDGSDVTLTATAASGSRFSGWSGSGCTGTSACTVTMDAARSVTATFVAQHALTLTKAGSGSGTVTSAPAGVTCGSTCASDFDDGTEVTLTASAASGSRFAGWAGSGCSGVATCTVTLTAARAVSAVFVRRHALSVAKAGSGSGSVTGDGIDCGSTCAADYDEETEVTLAANAAPGSRFAGWSGSGCSGNGTCTVTMAAARSITATFVAVHALAVAKTGPGSGTVSGGGIDCGVVCDAEYDEGTEVTLTAAAAAGSRFTGWSGAGCSGMGTCTVTMAAARTVVARFVEVYPLTVARTGSGTGTVAGDGIDCGSTCGADYDAGTVVTLTATAAPGSRFAGWTGGGCAGTGTCTIALDGARAVTAEFVALHPLSVEKTGSGAGTVAADLGALLCGATCSTDYDAGTSVTLTAVPDAGSRFAGWSGAGCSGTGTCTVAMSAARNVTAAFVAQHILTVTKTGSGSGTVAGGGLDCGATCMATFDEGTVVTVAATAAAGSSFTGWSGTGCSGTGTCTVTMSAARTLSAEFTIDAAPQTPPPPPARHALTLTKAGSGDGVVSGAGTDCGSTCSATFDDGAVVVLHAKAGRGSRFAGWSGDECSGREACTVTMTSPRHVTATFVRLVPLRVAVSGRGRVTSVGGGIDCGASCGMSYDADTLVTLVARPRRGHWLAGWSGDCAGRAERCTVAMDRARGVRARFAPNLELALTTTVGLVYHLPYERARIQTRATWQGRPLVGAAVRVSTSCRGHRVTRVLRTNRHGRAAFRWGTRLPNRIRVLRCAVDARVAANGHAATADRRSVGFIHPLWLKVKRWKDRSAVVRIWGRPGAAVVLVRNGDVIAETRIGGKGWVDVSSPRIRRGDGLHARGKNHHHSHVIGA